MSHKTRYYTQISILYINVYANLFVIFIVNKKYFLQNVYLPNIMNIQSPNS